MSAARFKSILITTPFPAWPGLIFIDIVYQIPPDLNTRRGKNSRFRHTLRFFRAVVENTLDNPRAKCYIKQALNDKAYARVVELADSLDSGSSVHSGRAGSSPASRTKTPRASAPGVFFAAVRLPPDAKKHHADVWCLITHFSFSRSLCRYCILSACSDLI